MDRLPIIVLKEIFRESSMIQSDINQFKSQTILEKESQN